MAPKRIVISRTDSIGDVILTLPLAGVLKSRFPDCTVIFLGRQYTGPVIRACSHVGSFVDWDEIRNLPRKEQVGFLTALAADVVIHAFPVKEIAFLAKKARIPVRIGTGRRWFHWFSCTRSLSFSRKNSSLHEAQLNLKLLSPLGIEKKFSFDEIAQNYGLKGKNPPLPNPLNALTTSARATIILHPGSLGSAVEWGLENFVELIRILPPKKFKVFITGSKEEGKSFIPRIPFDDENVINLAGKLTLDELIIFIAGADALIAASTGPLHIAAATGILAIGLFSPRKPIHPGRWAPIGENAHALVFDENCSGCKEGLICDCVKRIPPEKIKSLVEKHTLRL
ncbi:MAG: glycosyltransferase family 9 protein [Nitrospinota bacterium]